jgi:hypothetical protein
VCCTSRRSDGAPGERIADRPVNASIHPAGLPIANTSTLEVLRRPVESTQVAAHRVVERNERAIATWRREVRPAGKR